MLRAKRDTRGGAASKAIPSLGEIEGRMMILELIALTALTIGCIGGYVDQTRLPVHQKPN